MKNKLVVEVAFISPTEQFVGSVQLEPGATVKDALTQSGVLKQCKDVTLNGDTFSHPMAIFGAKATLDSKLNHGDRIDILRPLKLSAIQARELRAVKQKQKQTA